MPRSVSVQTRRRKLTRDAINKLASGRPVSRVEAFGTPYKKDQKWTFAVLRHWLDTGDVKRSGNRYVLAVNPGTFNRRYANDKVIDGLIDGDTSAVNTDDVAAAAAAAEQRYDSVKDLVAAVKRRKSDGTVVPASPTFEGMNLLPPKEPTVQLDDLDDAVEVDEQPASGDEQCSFCLSYVSEVGEMLIASRPGVFICKACVMQAMDVFDVQPEAKSPAAESAPQPETPQSSIDRRMGDEKQPDEKQPDDSTEATDNELLKGVVVWLSDVSDRLATMAQQQKEFQTWFRSVWE